MGLKKYKPRFLTKKQADKLNAKPVNSAILFITDRQRTARMNGEQIEMQEYECGKCKEYLLLPVVVKLKYCPLCGIKFDKIEDCSA